MPTYTDHRAPLTIKEEEEEKKNSRSPQSTHRRSPTRTRAHNASAISRLARPESDIARVDFLSTRGPSSSSRSGAVRLARSKLSHLSTAMKAAATAHLTQSASERGANIAFVMPTSEFRCAGYRSSWTRWWLKFSTVYGCVVLKWAFTFIDVVGNGGGGYILFLNMVY